MQKKSLLIILGLIFGISLVFSLFETNQNAFEKDYIKAEQSVHQYQKDFEKLFTDSEFIERIAENSLNANQLHRLQENNFYLFVYNSEQKLVFWSTNNVVPETDIDNIEENGSLLILKNGYYLALKQRYGSYWFVSLQLIKHNYPIVNKYLSNHFIKPYEFSDEIELKEADFSLGVPVKNVQNNTVFKLTFDNFPKQDPSFIGIATSYLSVIFFWIFAFYIMQALKNRFSLKARYFTLIIICTLFFTLIAYFPFEFKKTILFSPELFASQYYGSSLGNLFFNSFIIFILGSFAAYYFYNKKWFFNTLTFILYAVFIIALFILYNAVIKSLLQDSVISFEINNFTLSNIYTIIALLIIVFLSFTLFIYLFIGLYGCYKLFGNKSYFLLVCFMLLVGAILYILSYQLVAFIVPLICSVILFIYLYLLLNRKHFNRFNFSVSTLILFSLLIAFLVSYYNLKNEDANKERIANELNETRDLITEIRFDEIQQNIKQDPFFKKFFVSPFVSQKELLQRLNYMYFGGYLSKYNVNSYAFNNEGTAIKTSDTIRLNYFNDLVNQQAEKTASSSLFLVPQEDGKSYYLSILPIENEGQVAGSLVIELSLKTYHRDNLYPELLIEEKTNPIAKYRQEKDYEYAIYKNDYLISQTGEYPFPYYFGVFDTQNAFPLVQNINSFRLNFFLVSDDTKVVISSLRHSVLIPISTFSYIFFLNGLMVLFLFLLIKLFDIDSNSAIFRPIKFTFKNKINAAVIFITIASFTLIGIVTISYFKDSYRQNNIDKLIKKQKSVLSSIEYLLANNQVNSAGIIPSNFNTEIATLAEIQSIDINIFTNEGDLLISSQPGIFGNGLVSKKINPSALYQIGVLQNERFTQEESINALKYQSVYVPIRLNNGLTFGILNLPYFAQEETLRAELSNLMVALVNVYVLLLVGAIFIAFIISNSITSPLAEISTKLSTISLGSKNERIEWKDEDEIGALVKEYNNMISQIEESAQLMARSERESAWREMAKQIAHEIKNPLTPMKLSIQHLQRAIKDEREDVPQLAQKVSNTLIEQIDNLSEIATAFSSFAKMPTAQKEEVDLNDVLENVVSLFNEHISNKIKLSSHIDPAFVFADKNQLISVFNNLVKNAQQAIEENENGLINVSLKLDQNNFIITVEDNGIGISEDKKDKVFVPNFTTKSSGTGLGLAISKQIIENSNGAIWFESEENKGTTFYVSIVKHHV